jgi:hypothetical protein
MKRTAIVLAFAMLVPTALAGCIGGSGSPAEPAGEEAGPDSADEEDPRVPETNETGPEPPEGEDWTGLQPVDLIFDGSLRVNDTRVLLIPPANGDLGQPTNDSRSAMAYLEATLTGIYAWEPAFERFVAEHPEYSYLENVTVHVDVFDGTQTDTAGYDFVIGYAETSGPAFRGVAFQPPGNDDQRIQQTLDDAGLGDTVHIGNRYVLLSLFASAPRAGQDVPDYPEKHEIRGVTMHEFAHVWGLGHSTTWTKAYGPDLMNSPYPFVYGDGDPASDGGERSHPHCITSLDLYGLAHLYRWMPNGTWEESQGNVSLPTDVDYVEYCEVFGEARERAQRTLAEHGIHSAGDLEALTPSG